MKAVIQRVSRASVEVAGKPVASISGGMLVFAGVEKGDSEKDVSCLSDKIAGLRIFDDANGKMNLSVADTGGSILIVSQFTLCSDCRKGKRPGFDNAMEAAGAAKLFAELVSCIRARGIKTETGVFGAEMTVNISNAGPVTFILDSKK
ncbi:MAG: D-tyrosyl-tRNA(Tyr) deacylase [Candidatus Aureabacteria bacterium]|nr:D-tyrosyl-tRNA(Tyr) deacylase [Candidatus Auribacterota bacterium]